MTLSPFQIVSCPDFFKYIIFATHLDIQVGMEGILAFVIKWSTTVKLMRLYLSL